jgi:general stress protein YciG
MTLKEFARAGGKARAAALSKERRIEIARGAGKASAEKRKQRSCQLTGKPENVTK